MSWESAATDDGSGSEDGSSSVEEGADLPVRVPGVSGEAPWEARSSFKAPPGMGNGHLMTILGSLRWRRFPTLERSMPIEARTFATEPETTVLAYCHWQPQRHAHPTVLIVHGLEGSADAAYVRGTAEKAWQFGWNVLRYNVRGCGGTAHLAPKLYHSGLTSDLRVVVRELVERDGLPGISLVGFSMGGNQVLKLAGELGEEGPRLLRTVCAISPPIDLASCSRSIAEPRNWIYEARFLRSLRRTIREKDHLFPGRYDLGPLSRIRHLWEWDNHFQPYHGFKDAWDYYARASALPWIPAIEVPTLLIHAQDDPFIPFAPFEDPRVRRNGAVHLLAPRQGGHVAFCGRRQGDPDRAWAENRAVEFLQSQRGGER
jgi:predicted alpha/beta-fold hydrolase